MAEQLSPIWRPGNEWNLPAPSDVDLWRIDLAPDTPLRRALPPDTAHPQRTATHRARDAILARYTRLTPHTLVYATSPGGKPYLDIPGTTIDFNISHCAEFALVAVSRHGQVGVDVETISPVADPMRLARRVMSGHDVAELEALQGDARIARFFGLWTTLEARQKAFGKGIFARQVDGSKLDTCAFSVAAQTVGCVAVEKSSRHCTLRFFDYVHS